MNAKKPRVSIGLPVFNGEKYLEHALDSILTQTYRDFELIIADNASTDQTQHICRAYAAKDDRIRYHRNEKNIGAAPNHNLVFKLASSPYFKWLAHDDLMAPDYLLKCLSAFDENPSLALCHSKTRKIDEYGKSIGTYSHTLKIDSPKLYERFGALIYLEKKPAWCMIFGVIRSNILKKTALFGDYISSDMTLLAEISLHGPFCEVPEYLYSRRDHPHAYSAKYYVNTTSPNPFEKLRWWNPNINRAIALPYWKICSEYVNAVKRASLKWSERVLCYDQIGKWLIREGLLNMARDVNHAFLQSSSLGRRISAVIKRMIERGNK
jgi:glycosyltransferase involved in cell wall biosynthesis